MAQAMPKQKRNQQFTEDSEADFPESERSRERRGKDHARRSGGERGHSERQGIPRWRKIEIMRERAQLREALGGVDLFDDFDDFEEEVFGSEEEYEVFYRHSDDEEEEEIELEDDDFEDDEFEESEED